METQPLLKPTRVALLLNSGYEPLRVVSWQRAFVLVFQEKVEVLEEYGHFIRTVSQHFPVPAVLRLRRFINLNRRMPVIRFSRSNLYLRDSHRCQYCHQRFPERYLTLDHLVPVFQGGKKNWENIVTACLDCNQKKGHKTPQQIGFKLLKKPKAPRWLPGSFGTFRTKAPPSAWQPYLNLAPLGIKSGN